MYIILIIIIIIQINQSIHPPPWILSNLFLSYICLTRLVILGP